MVVLKYKFFGSNTLMHANISPLAGHYDDPAELMDMINGAFAAVEWESSYRFNYNSITKKMFIEFLGPMPVTLSMPKEFEELLGFDWLKKPRGWRIQYKFRCRYKRGLYWRCVWHVGIQYEWKISIQRQRSMWSSTWIPFAYSDAVQPIIVGATKVPLLRSVNVNEESWRMITRIYEMIQYSPVQRKQFMLSK